MNKVICTLTQEEVSGIEKLFGRITALKSLMYALADDKKLFDEKNHLYERALEDVQVTQKHYDAWFYEIIEKYGLGEYKKESLNVDFNTKELSAMV